MTHLRAFFVANVVITRFFCRKCRDYALFGVEFWQKFLEILRILAEILRKKLACGASDLDIDSILHAFITFATAQGFCQARTCQIRSTRVADDG